MNNMKYILNNNALWNIYVNLKNNDRQNVNDS